VLLGIGAASLAFWASWPKQSLHAGKTIGYWSKEFRSGGQRREKAEQAFRAMGSNAVPFLIVALNQKESALHRKFTSLVQQSPLFLHRFFTLPKDPPEFLRGRAGVVLADIAAPATPSTVAALRRTLDDPFHGVRNNAVVALGKTAPRTKVASQALAALIHATEDGNFMVRGNAYFFLGRFAPEASEAIPVLHHGLEDPNIYVRRNATNALAAFETPPASSENK